MSPYDDYIHLMHDFYPITECQQLVKFFSEPTVGITTTSWLVSCPDCIAKYESKGYNIQRYDYPFHGLRF